MHDKPDTGARTYIPMPPAPKPAGSEDNASEMAAGGDHERAALQQAHDTAPTPSPTVAGAIAGAAGGGAELGNTDNPHGTGVGYAGEGSETYGTQGATGDTATLHKLAGEKQEER